MYCADKDVESRAAVGTTTNDFIIIVPVHIYYWVFHYSIVRKFVFLPLNLR
jgi:hypothetical protein